MGSGLATVPTFRRRRRGSETRVNCLPNTQVMPGTECASPALRPSSSPRPGGPGGGGGGQRAGWRPGEVAAPHLLAAAAAGGAAAGGRCARWAVMAAVGYMAAETGRRDTGRTWGEGRGARGAGLRLRARSQPRVGPRRVLGRWMGVVTGRVRGLREVLRQQGKSRRKGVIIEWWGHD